MKPTQADRRTKPKMNRHTHVSGATTNQRNVFDPCLGQNGYGVVQLDYDEEMEPLRGMCGSVEAEYEVQRTITRAELTAFECILKKVIVPIKVHVDNKGIIGWLRQERKSLSSQEREMQTYGSKTWE